MSTNPYEPPKGNEARVGRSRLKAIAILLIVAALWIAFAIVTAAILLLAIAVAIDYPWQ